MIHHNFAVRNWKTSNFCPLNFFSRLTQQKILHGNIRKERQLRKLRRRKIFLLKTIPFPRKFSTMFTSFDNFCTKYPTKHLSWVFEFSLRVFGVNSEHFQLSCKHSGKFVFPHEKARSKAQLAILKNFFWFTESSHFSYCWMVFRAFKQNVRLSLLSAQVLWNLILQLGCECVGIFERRNEYFRNLGNWM